MVVMGPVPILFRRIVYSPGKILLIGRILLIGYYGAGLLDRTYRDVLGHPGI